MTVVYHLFLRLVFWWLYLLWGFFPFLQRCLVRPRHGTRSRSVGTIGFHCWNRRIFLRDSMGFHGFLCDSMPTPLVGSRRFLLYDHLSVVSRRFYPSIMYIMSQSSPSYLRIDTLSPSASTFTIPQRVPFRVNYHVLIRIFQPTNFAKNPHIQDPLAFEIFAKSLDLRLKALVG